MARKTLGVIMRASSLMFRQASHKPSRTAIAYGRKLTGLRPGPVQLAGQSRGGFLAMHYAPASNPAWYFARRGAQSFNACGWR